MQVQSLGWEDPLEEGTATYSSILACRIPWTEEPGRLYSIWLQRVGSNLACLHTDNHELGIENLEHFSYKER